jgi:mono/diheme cytochrome c family protein
MRWVAAILLGAMAAALAAQAYTLPEEKPITLPRGAGVELVEAHCSACHSLDYLARIIHQTGHSGLASVA